MNGPQVSEMPVNGQNPPLTMKASWYNYIDSVSHNMMGVKTANVILLAWAIISVGFSYNNALQPKTNLFNQMHAVPYDGLLGAPPSHYASMDWIMTAKRVMSGSVFQYVGGAVSNELCLDGDRNCSPEVWQMHQGCSKDPATTRLFPPGVEEEQDYFYASKKTKYRNLQPMFTCLAEKIGNLAVFQNNEHSYSIGSTHNVNVLVAAVFMICAVILATSLISTMQRQVGAEVEYEYPKRMFLTVLVLFYLTFTYGFASSQALDGETDLHRPVGLASYAYSTVALLFTLFIFNRSGILQDNMLEQDRMEQDPDDNVPIAPVSPDNDAAASEGAAAPSSNPDGQLGFLQRDTKFQMMPLATLNVRRFVNEPMHFDTRIKTFISGPPISGPATQDGTPPMAVNVVTVDICKLISNPVHSKFVYGQFLTLPLALMALCMHGSNYGLDTYSQVVFVCALVYSLVDVFLYRMWWAFQIHKGVTFYQEDDREEYRAMEVLTVLCIFLQISILVFFILSELFNELYMWFFVVYIFFSTIPKIVAMMAIRSHKQIFHYGATGPHPSTNFDAVTGTLQKSDFYMFVVYTFLLTIVLWPYVIMGQRELKAEWAKSIPMVDRWGPGWQSYNAMSM
jgi:hypothetical protein